MPTFKLTNDNFENPDEQWLRETWSQNGGPFLLNLITLRGSLAGHSFVKIIPESKRFPFIRLSSLDPSTVSVYWKSDDKEWTLWYEIYWVNGRTEFIQDIVYNEVANNWSIIDYKRTSGGSGWELILVTEWDFPYPPLIEWPHIPSIEGYYGQSETPDTLLKMNEQINKIGTDISRILRLHAFPKTIGIGIDSEEIQATAIDNLWTVSNDKANIFNLEMQSDLTSSMNMLNYLSDEFLAIARVVIIKGSVKDFQRVTNTGIRAVFLDMIAKNMVLRWTYGRALQRICQVMLMIDGRAFEMLPNIVWPDPLPEDDTEAINTLAIERALKLVSHEDASTKRGYDWREQVKKMLAESELEFLQAPEKEENKPGEGSAPAKTDKNEIKS